MALVRGRTGIGSPTIDTNIGEEVRQQNESRQEAKTINDYLNTTGQSVDTTRSIDSKGFSNAITEYNNWLAALPNQQAAVSISNLTPRISIENGSVKLSGTQQALDSELGKYVKQQLDNNIKYNTDVASADFGKFIDELNKTAQQQAVFEAGANEAQNAFGWTRDQYAEYVNNAKITTSNNPKTNSGLIHAKKKDGSDDWMTYSDWVEYLRSLNRGDREKYVAASSRAVRDPLQLAIYQIASRSDGLSGKAASTDTFSIGEKILTGLESGGLQAVGGVGTKIVSDIASAYKDFVSMRTDRTPENMPKLLSLYSQNEELQNKLNVYRKNIQREINENKILAPVATNLGLFAEKVGEYVLESELAGAGIGAAASALPAVTSATAIASGIPAGSAVAGAEAIASGARGTRLMNLGDQFSSAFIKQLSKENISGAERLLSTIAAGNTPQNVIKLFGLSKDGGEKAARAVGLIAGIHKFATNFSPRLQAWGINTAGEIFEDVIQTAVAQQVSGPDLETDIRDNKFTSEDFVENALGTIAVKAGFSGLGTIGRVLGTPQIAKMVKDSLGDRFSLRQAGKLIKNVDDQADALRLVLSGDGSIIRIKDGVPTVRLNNGKEYTLDKIFLGDFDTTGAPNDAAVRVIEDYKSLARMGEDAGISPVRNYAELNEIDPETNVAVYVVDDINDGSTVYTSRQAAQEAADGGKVSRKYVPAENLEVSGDGAGRLIYRANAIPTMNIDNLPDSASDAWNGAVLIRDVTDDTFATTLRQPPTLRNLFEYRNWKASLKDYLDNKTAEIVDAARNLAERKGMSLEDLTRQFDIARREATQDLPSTVDQEIKDFYNNTIEPFLAPLRETAYAKAGLEEVAHEYYLPQIADTTVIDLFPDSDTVLRQGNLFKQNRGIISGEADGAFDASRISGDLEKRLSYATNQLLTEAGGDEGWIYQKMYEAHINGDPMTVRQARQILGMENAVREEVADSAANVHLEKQFADMSVDTSPTENSTKSWKEFYNEMRSEGKKSEIVEKIHRAFNEGMPTGRSWTQHSMVSQSSGTLTQTSDTMRKIRADGIGSLYDNGGALLTKPASFAAEVTENVFERGTDINDAVSQMVTRFAGLRTPEAIADRTAKIVNELQTAARGDQITRGEMTAILSKHLRNMGESRVQKWIAQIDLSTMSVGTKNYLNNFLFQHNFYRGISQNSKIRTALEKAAQKLVGARYDAVMSFNFKNALLQGTESMRLFTMNGLGSALDTVKKLNTDEEFNALVDSYYRIHAPEALKANMTGINDAMETILDKIKKVGNDYEVGVIDSIEGLRLGGIEAMESWKNRTLLAGIVNDTMRKGTFGDVGSPRFDAEVRRRFEREALAGDAMGRLGMSNSPFGRVATMFMQFPIRELEMHIYTIRDLNEVAGGGLRGALSAAGYVSRLFGTKLATFLFLAPLGYSAAQVSGLDPFDLANNNYTGIDEERMTALDRFMNSSLFAGAILSTVPDIYFMYRRGYEEARSAYEAEHPEEAGMDTTNMFARFGSPEDIEGSWADIIAGYIPGGSAARRGLQMAELMETGEAVSRSGATQYVAPDNFFDIATGFIFGRSATPAAREYLQRPDLIKGVAESISQRSLAPLGQQLSRTARQFNPNREFREFDSYSEDYSDWFDGTANDGQQLSTAMYAFSDEIEDIRNSYNERYNNARTDEDRLAVRSAGNRALDEVAEKIRTLFEAYQTKHPEGVPETASRWGINLLQRSTGFEGEESYDPYNEAVSRYARAGIPSASGLGRITDSEDELTYVRNYALENAIKNLYGASNTAPGVIKDIYDTYLKDAHDAAKSRVSALYDRINATKSRSERNALYDEIEAVQKEYLARFDAVMEPIFEQLGTNAISSADVENELERTLSQMVPSDEYRVNKKGKTIYQSTPYMTADISKWLQNRYKNLPKTNAIPTDASTSNQLSEIQSMIDAGRESAAKARARVLLERVRQNRASLTRPELEWIQGVLND